MTERLYYTDSYVREFSARVLEIRGDLAYLDRTAFYPSSGGQPCDMGSIAGAAVVAVMDEGERIAHRVSAPLEAGEAACRLDWQRRFDHMQQHTGQHLLSAVFAALHGAGTVGFHLGQESATIDLETGVLSGDEIREAERHANRIVFENRPVRVVFEDARTASGLRKPSERQGTLRIIEIEGLDRSACGGTHVRATGEIGVISIRKLEKIRGTVRVEFLCGERAVRRARADFEALTRVAQMFSAPLDDTADMVSAHMEAARAAGKQLEKAQTELAGYHGRELHAATPPDAGGLRRHVRRVPAGAVDQFRALAQSFTAGSRAVFLGIVEEPPSLLLAASADAGMDAGKLVKAAVTEAGGRGGGTARMAQGSVPSREALELALARL